MLKMNDIRLGDCYRWTGAAAEKHDTVPRYADTKANRNMPADIPVRDEDGGWDSCNIDDQEESPKWWRDHGDLPVEILEHYSRSKVPTVLTRGHIRPGECFQYLDPDISSRSFIMVNNLHDYDFDVPNGWTVADVNRSDVKHRRVRRIPRWDFTGKWCGVPLADEPAQPIINPALAQALAEECNGLTGEECLRRFELGQQMESIAKPWKTSSEMVSTYKEGLDHHQIALARKVWSLKLADLQATQKARDKARSVSIVTDNLHPDDYLDDSAFES